MLDRLAPARDEHTSRSGAAHPAVAHLPAAAGDAARAAVLPVCLGIDADRVALERAGRAAEVAKKRRAWLQESEQALARGSSVGPRDVASVVVIEPKKPAVL